MTHMFSIVDAESDEVYANNGMLSITVSDELILYISDSLKWIDSLWNGKELKQSINYYGFSYIEGENIERLALITKRWANLFECIKTDKALLTFGSVIEENKVLTDKREIDVDQFRKMLLQINGICTVAKKEGKKILYNGI